MSTLAALVLISSSAVAKDFYKGFVKPDATDRQLTALMRWGSGFFIVLSIVLAYFKPGVIVTVLSISWGAIASIFLGPFIWGIFTRWVNRTGAVVSAILGLGTCIALTFVWGLSKTPQSGAVGMIVSLAAAPVAGLLTRRSGDGG
jgi:Na+/proline symporter